jgi:hypothetical protein
MDQTRQIEYRSGTGRFSLDAGGIPGIDLCAGDQNALSGFGKTLVGSLGRQDSPLRPEGPILIEFLGNYSSFND